MASQRPGVRIRQCYCKGKQNVMSKYGISPAEMDVEHRVQIWANAMPHDRDAFAAICSSAWNYAHNWRTVTWEQADFSLV